MLLFTGKEFKYRSVLNLAVVLLPLYTFRYLATNYNTQDLSEWVIPSICYLGAILLYFVPSLGERLAKRLIASLRSYMGSAEYRMVFIYIIHFPLLFLFSRIDAFSGTPGTWLIRLVCYLLLCFLAAYWLEKVYQPIARKWIGW